jgi:glutathione synthase/RimK-type ligase-like ATP-grasp enzyme
MKNEDSDILVLFGGRMSDHLHQIKKELEIRGENPSFGNYRALTFKSQGLDFSPKLTWRGIDLKDFKVIFFRLIGPRWELVTLINVYLEEEIKQGKIILIDPLAESLKRYLGLKLGQVLALQKEDIPTPRTFWGHLEKIRKKASEEISFPMVVKRSGGRQGERVHLAKNQDQLNEIVNKLMPQEKEDNKRFIVQEFIPNQEDIRVLVLDNRALGGIRRIRTEDEFRNNVSRGGRAELIKRLPDNLANIAVKAAAAVDLSFAGVDIVEDEKTGQPYVLEINRAPQYSGFMRASGMNVPAKLAEFLIRKKKKLK